MWRTSMRRWSKTRERGMRSWVLSRGVLGWGVPMYFVMSVMQVAWHPGDWRSIALIDLPIWIGGGVLWGAVTWWTMEWRYRRHLRQAGGG